MSSHRCQVQVDVLLSNKFPGKLWRLLNTCISGAIGWGPTGHTIYVHQYKFQQEYLDPPNTHFKTKNIGSFIRQLNLYGFKKLNVPRYGSRTSNFGREIYEFHNEQFVRGRPDLVCKLTRNVGVRRSREAALKRRLQFITNNNSSTLHNFCNQSQFYHSEQLVGHCRISELENLPTSQNHQQVRHPMDDAPLMNTTPSGHWPMYIQWDKGSYKYVVLPGNERKSNTSACTVHDPTCMQPPIQKPNTVDVHNTATFPLIHVSDNSGCQQEYYVVTLLSDGTTVPPNKMFPLQSEMLQHISQSMQIAGQDVQDKDTSLSIASSCDTVNMVSVTQEQTDAIFQLLTQQYPRLLNSTELMENETPLCPAFASIASSPSIDIQSQSNYKSSNNCSARPKECDLWVSGDGGVTSSEEFQYKCSKSNTTPIDLSHHGNHQLNRVQLHPSKCKSASDIVFKSQWKLDQNCGEDHHSLFGSS